MTQESHAKIELEKLQSKGLHDLMLRMLVKDGFCRFYGGYVAVGRTAEFPDGTVQRCAATETFVPIDEN
jgi:hypothetical protein